MGRIISSRASGGASAVMTQAEVSALIQQTAEYEFVKTINVTAEVASISITGLDGSVFSHYRFIPKGLGYGGSAAQNNWYNRILLNSAGSEDTGTNYSYETIRWSAVAAEVLTGQAQWTIYFGYGGHPSNADFVLDLHLKPNAATYDVTGTMRHGYAKSGNNGYTGISSFVHTRSGSDVPTGIKLAPSNGFISMGGTAQIDVFGMRVRT